MKRKFDEISNEQGSTQKIEDLYGPETKKRKIEGQKIGDFIVDAKNSFYFRLSSDINKLEDQEATSLFFSPVYMHQMFGQQERISGYEGLSVDITLSKKRLIPFVQISYQSKAPAFANVDNVQEKLEKLYGRIHTQGSTFTQVLKEEETMKPYGEKIEEFQNRDKTFVIHKVSLEDEQFHEQSFYFQCLLPFFIDGASQIEPSIFWSYFIIYEQSTNNVIGLATVFEAHHSIEKFRAKVSQVLILPTYQKRGFGAKLYQTIYDHYRNNRQKCFEIIVEDPSDDFQRILDSVNTSIYFKHNIALRDQMKQLPISNVILNEKILKSLQLSKDQVKQYAQELKLPSQIILRVHELILYSALDKNETVQKAYRIAVKKRYYVRCVRDYISLFKNIANGILEQKGGIQEPYLFSDQLEEDPFLRANSLEEEKDSKAKEGEKVLTQEAVKIQLNTLYQEVINQYEQLMPAVKKLIYAQQS